MTKTGEAARPAAAIEPEDLGEFWVLHSRKIIGAGIVLAALVGGTVLVRRSAQIREERAGQAYAAAEGSYMSGNKALAVTELEKVVARYAGTTSGTQAAMLIAQNLMEQGKPEDALTQLNAALGKAPAELKAGIYALIGAAHESAGRPVEAAAAYGRAAEASEFVPDRDMQLIEQARNLVAANDLAGAERIYSEMARREDSPFSGEARVRLGEVLGLKK